MKTTVRSVLSATNKSLQNFKFPLRSSWELRFFWASAQREVVIPYDVSGQHIGPDIFLTLKDGTDTLSRNVGNELPLHAS